MLPSNLSVPQLLTQLPATVHQPLTSHSPAAHQPLTSLSPAGHLLVTVFQAHPEVAVVERLEDLWRLSKLQAERKAREQQQQQQQQAQAGAGAAVAAAAAVAGTMPAPVTSTDEPLAAAQSSKPALQAPPTVSATSVAADSVAAGSAGCIDAEGESAVVDLNALD